MIHLKHPMVLGLLVLVAVVWWAWGRAGLRAGIRFSSVRRLLAAASAGVPRARYALPVLRSVVVALLVLCLARPQMADEQTRVQTQGIAIQIVLDRSGSMAQEDFLDDSGQPQSRLAVVRDVVQRFVTGDEGRLKGRPDDLIGLIVFARYADTECPLTLDHRHLVRALKRVSVPRTQDEDGTAIGDALVLAVERIRKIDRRFQHEGELRIRSRAIVLLTDGEQNCGKRLPSEAAEVAAKLGIRIYAIGAAPDFQEQEFGGLLFPARRVRVPVTINETALQEVAEMTGGKYFRARDQASLEKIYAEIDKLERTVIDERRYYLYHELAYNWARLGGLVLPPPLLVALLVLGLEVVLVNTRFRTIP